MDRIHNTRSFMRITHRYLGYFMAGIMTVYAVSGVLLVYRDTDVLKKEKNYEKVFEKNLDEKALGKEIKIKGFEVEKTENGILYFKTDHDQYYEDVLDLVEGLENYKVIYHTSNLHQSEKVEENIKTEFEHLFLHKHQKNINYIEIQKIK